MDDMARGRRGKVRHLPEVEVAGIADKSLAGEENHRLSTFPSTRSPALKSGDIIETVNLQSDIEEIQRELRTALSVELGVSRSGNHEVRERFSRVLT